MPTSHGIVKPRRGVMTGRRAVETRQAAAIADWWRSGVVYQIYPRSFADSDGDGVGDLAGIIAHLDHLAGRDDSLGVDAIWLSPIYPSPGRDLGYDVSDHGSIDPLFGSMADFERLVAEAHRRGLRVMLDLVLNHTSDEHPWFRASRASRVGPYAERYLWRDPAGFDGGGRPIPPNNWISFFGGPGWEWEPQRGQLYQHIFLAEQPDLNWRDPGTRVEMWQMIRGWLERGVDGFRLDTFNNFLKDPELRSNPTRPGRSAWTRQHHIHEKDQSDLPALLAEFRAIVDERPGRMSVGELFDGTVEQAAALTVPGHLVFDFELLSQPWSAAAFARALDRREAAYGSSRWPTVVFSNHDQPRVVARWGAGADDPDRVARLAALLLLTLRGTPFLYYGEELGVPGIVVEVEDAIDPPARRVGPDFPWWNRDQARAPMPWDGSPGAGFTAGRPWLPLPRDAARRNVAAQRADPDSTLAFYRRLIAMRRATPALHRGDFARLPTTARGTLGFVRTFADDQSLVVANFSGRAVTTEVAPVGGGSWRSVASTHDRLGVGLTDGGRIRLEALEGLILGPER
jgi:alpha-glucosidase